MNAAPRARLGVGYWVLQLVLVASIVGFASRTWLQMGNTLHENARWESTKVDLAYGILGAVSFVTTRTALHRERLDLGAWHGHHELRLREAHRVDGLELRFRLQREGTFTVRLDEQALRFSRNPGEQSLCLGVSEAGRFRDVEALPLLELDPSWHHLRWWGEAGVMQVELDGRPLGPCGESSDTPRVIALRSTAGKKTHVDDLRVMAEGAEVFSEDFRNRRGGIVVLAVVLGAILLVDALLLFATRRSRATGETRGALVLLASHLVLVLTAGLFFAAEWIYFGRLHPDEPDFKGYPNRIEYRKQVVPRLAETYPPTPAPPGVRRVVFLGSSQTWGSGAVSTDDTWVARLEARWNEGLPEGMRVECINTGIPAYTAKEIRPLWEEDWSRWQPELVVVDLANNDRDPVELGAELDALVAFNRERGIRTVLILEPNTEESRSAKSLAGLHERHAAMRAVGERQGIPVLDLHGAMKPLRAEGFVWWDRVHLTSFGHARMADEVDRHRALLLP